VNLQESIQPFSELWKAIGVFMDAKKRWMTNPIVELDSTEVEMIIKNQLKVS
jgi:dynein heavy chain